MPNILSSEQIRNMKDLNIDAIKVYLKLAEKRLADTIEVKKQFDQKAFNFLGGYVTAALALFGLSEKFTAISFWLNLTAIIFCIGVVPIFLSLKSSTYGTLGRHPKDWLESENYLTVKSGNMAHIYAYLLRDIAPRIDQSKRINKKKASYLNIAVLIGIFSLCPFLFKVLFSL